MAQRGGDQQTVRPGFLIAGGVALAAVIVYALITFVFAGDDAPEPTPPPQAAPQTTAPAISPIPDVDVPEDEELEVFEIFEGRDPFRPLIFDQPGGDGGDGVEAPPPTPLPNGEPPPTPAPTAPPPRSGVQVEVLSVADDSSSATVRVGSRVFENATEGQTLDSGVVVVDIADPCVDFRRNGNTFTLCEGEQVLK